MTISEPIIVAGLRAFVGGILTGALAALGTYTQTSSEHSTIVVGLSSMLGYWIVRGGFEGIADQAISTVNKANASGGGLG